MKELLTLLIIIGNSYQLNTGNETVNMVAFDCEASGPYFQGKTLPGGVDTQHYTAAGGSLSARYMLEGTDSTGRACRVFIENNATPDMPKGTTRPRVLTDSPFLQQRFNGELQGRMDWKDGKLYIHVLRKD